MSERVAALLSEVSFRSENGFYTTLDQASAAHAKILGEAIGSRG
jgi:hypothetical protein